jgi:hypothetical protein
MKRILLQAVIITVLSGLCMNGKAGDTLRINVTFKHELNSKGEPTGKQIVINQLFITEGNQKLREIFYDEKTGEMSGYLFYFYRDNRLFTEEYHNVHDSLMYILKHDYDKNGHEVALTRLVPVNGRLTVEQKTSKSYSASQKLSQVKVLYGKTTGSVTKYTYNPAGLLSTEKTIYKSIAKSPFKQEIKQYSYLPSEDKIDSVLITDTDLNQKNIQHGERYAYDKSGLLVSVKQYHSDHALQAERKYFYNQYQTLIRYDEYDGAGKLTLQQHYEYRKHFMEKGTQKSCYEDL